MIILAFLQNQWFRDPDAARRAFARHPDQRNRLIGMYLFMGCLTGRRLTMTLGEELCDQIIWEECSPEVGGQSSAAFPADIEHMRNAIALHKPDVILAFGRIAERGLEGIGVRPPLIIGPHPAARAGAIEGLRAVRTLLDKLIAEKASA